MNTQLPSAFVSRVEKDSFLGSTLVCVLDTEPIVSIRYNPSKQTLELPIQKAIPWSENGYFLSERPVFTLDPLFHVGCYYPQESGSQLLDAVLRQLNFPQDPNLLDLCAAPGGKSTLIASFLDNTGLLVANEIISNRATALKENLIKWGNSNTIVSNNEPSHFERLPHFFDCIVADVPCSGEGMFRKDLAAREHWSEHAVVNCANRQQEIIASCWESLKPNGYLIYSTCTFNSLENEENVSWIVNELGASVVPVSLPYAKKDRANLGFYALPSEMESEGFYIAVLQKDDGDIRKVKYDKYRSELEIISHLLKTPLVDLKTTTAVQWKNFLFAIPTQKITEIQRIHHHLRVIKLGTEMGEIHPKGLLPHHALAMDKSIQSDEIQHIELTKEQALLYLKGETFTLAGTHGYGLVTYQNEPLGWIKHLGNRFNNLYPKEYRIRMRLD